MTMLVPNWRRVLRYGWSVRLMVLAAVLTGLEAVLPMISDLLAVRTWWLTVITFLVIVGAFIARFLVQQKVSGENNEQA